MGKKGENIQSGIASGVAAVTAGIGAAAGAPLVSGIALGTWGAAAAGNAYINHLRDVGPMENLTVPRIESLLTNNDTIKNNPTAVAKLKEARHAIIRQAATCKKVYDRLKSKGKDTSKSGYDPNWRNTLTYGDTIRHPMLKNLGKDLHTLANTINNHKVATALVGSGAVVAASMAVGGKSALQSSKDFIEKIGNSIDLNGDGVTLADNFKKLVANFPGFVPMINGLVAVGAGIALVSAYCKIAKSIEAKNDYKKDLTAAVSDLDLKKDQSKVDKYIDETASDQVESGKGNFDQIVEMVLTNDSVYKELSTRLLEARADVASLGEKSAKVAQATKLGRIIEAVHQKRATLQAESDKLVSKGNLEKSIVESDIYKGFSLADLKNIQAINDATKSVADGDKTATYKIIREEELENGDKGKTTVFKEETLTAEEIVRAANGEYSYTPESGSDPKIVPAILKESRYSKLMTDLRTKNPDFSDEEILAAVANKAAVNHKVQTAEKSAGAIDLTASLDL